MIYHCEDLHVVSFMGCFTLYVRVLLNVPLCRLVYLTGIDLSRCNLVTSVSFMRYMPHLKDAHLDRLHYVMAGHFRLCLTEAHLLLRAVSLCWNLHLYSVHIVLVIMTMQNLEILDCRGTGPLLPEDMTHILTACKKMRICFFTPMALQHVRAE